MNTTVSNTIKQASSPSKIWNIMLPNLNIRDSETMMSKSTNNKIWFTKDLFPLDSFKLSSQSPDIINDR